MGRETFCDLPRSDTLSLERLRALRSLHETAAEQFGAALSTLLRCPIEVKLDGIEQLPYGRFLDRLTRLSYFNLLRAEPLGDSLLLDIEPAIVYPLIDRLLGGRRDDEPPPCRPLSDVELPLAARLVRLFLEQLCHAWRNVDLKLEVVQTESNPRLLRALPRDEMTASIDFRLTVGERRGMMRLCIPCRTIQRLDSVRAESAETALPAGPTMPPSTKEAPTEPASTVELQVTLATTPITAADLSGLRVGDIVATETLADSPAVVSIGGGPKFLAQPGVCRGRNAVRITAAIDER